ncbi:peptidylprolyl isomerase [Paenibacillus daejeonensis]|uniref:peptidylprolyl isomerase n=1 Tax=Paenibacillus daejeonensis TaxID=135193 RepID=UPI0003648150|nr:peptidylprolyl isomerase [Paenibacillus daejeonensis]
MLHNKRKSAWRRPLLLIIAAMLVMTIAAACGSKNDNNGGNGGTEGGTPNTGATIATYTDGTVTDDEFTKYKTFFILMNPQAEMFLSIPQYEEQFLQEYIGYKILFDRMSDESKAAADADTEEFRTQFETAVNDQEELQTRLDEGGLTVDEAVDFFHLIMAVMKDAESKVTDEDVQAIFNEDPSALQTASVRHVLVATTDSQTQEELRTEEEALERAEDVKAQLEAGGDWQALAAEYSDDPGSKENGGLYEDVNVSQWVPEFKDAALTQEVGVIGDPVKTDFGYHVVLVEKRDELTYESLTDEQKNALRQTAASEVLNEFMQTELPELIQSIDLPQPEAPEGTEPPATEGTENGDAGTDGATEDGAEGNAPADETPANEEAPATEEETPAQ